MAALAIAILFVLMVAAPCLVAMRNSRHIDDVEEVEVEELELPLEISTAAAGPVAIPVDAVVAEAAARANTENLQTLAVEAEIEAVMAKDRADRAHWEALTAAARAASLRADAASLAAQAASRAADRAIWAAEAGYESQYHLPENHPSLDFPRAPVSGRRAA